MREVGSEPQKGLPFEKDIAHGSSNFMSNAYAAPWMFEKRIV
jgi:hypothetical protein